MEVFNNYAAYYELLYRDKDYAGEAEYVYTLIREFGSRNNPTLLDVGCGTGIHAQYLNAKGFQVDGVDASENMIQQARNRNIPGAMFTLCNAQNFDLKKQYGIVTSLFHVVSYQTDNKSICGFFESVSRHLQPGGLFIFDVWYGPAVLTDRPAVRIKRLEDEYFNIIRLAEPVLYPNENCVDVNYEIKIADKRTQVTDTVRETHRMRYYFAPELELLLEQHSMKLIHKEEWMNRRQPSFDTWGVCFVAVRT